MASGKKFGIHEGVKIFLDTETQEQLAEFDAAVSAIQRQASDQEQEAAAKTKAEQEASGEPPKKVAMKILNTQC